MADPDNTAGDPPAKGVGGQLLAGRNAAGLSRADVAARTRIAERHLAALEEGRLGDLASRAYAVGFTRSYARTVGLDEAALVDQVRRELAALDAARAPARAAAFEPGDPARVPTAALAWLAALGGLGVLVLVFFAWRSFFVPAVPLPDLTQERPPAAVQAPALAGRRAAPAAPAAPASGPVVLTALEPGIWVKVYEAGGATTLLQKQLALGESFTVPAEARQPLLWTGRPDALQLAVGGKVLPPLADRQMILRDVSLAPAALLARPPAVPAATAAAAPPPPASSPVSR